MSVIINDVIKTLNLAHVKVLEIYDPRNRKETLTYYQVDTFTIPVNQINELVVVGRDITNIVSEDSLSVNAIDYRSRDNVILSKIDTLPQQRVSYSKDYVYRQFLYTQNLNPM